MTLELGGKSPHVVFADADLDEALPFLVILGQHPERGPDLFGRVLHPGAARGLRRGRCWNASARRYQGAGKVWGPPSTTTTSGPLIFATPARRSCRAIFEPAGPDGLDAAARRLPSSAGRPGRRPLFRPGSSCAARPFPATSASPRSIFGPIQVVIAFDDEDEAVAIANGTPYGLVAGAWTRDGARQFRLARRLRAGQVFINNYGAGGGVELPFGGWGQSGSRARRRASRPSMASPR